MKYILIFLLFLGCDSLYKTEESLKNSLDFFVNKKVDTLRSMWGAEDSQMEGINNKIVHLTYYKTVDIGSDKNLFKKDYYLKTGCVFTFTIDTRSLKILSCTYIGGKCYGANPVKIESNWK